VFNFINRTSDRMAKQQSEHCSDEYS